MLINQANLDIAFINFNAAFNRGREVATSQFRRIVTEVPSTSRKNLYGWLGQIPGFREWIGDRVIQNLEAHDYEIVNKSYENTIQVDRDDFQDDQLGIYTPMFQELGVNTTVHPDTLAWPLLAAGFSTTCYDGQYLFDTDHPVLDKHGEPQSVANTDGGGGTPWFLLDDSRALRPVIYQPRSPYDLVALDRPTDQNVFMRKKFVYGVDARVGFGYGLWQVAWGSKQTLNKANYRNAREALMSMKRDYEVPLGLMPRLLVVPPSLEGEALEILNAERDAAGATNVYKGTAQLLVVPWLA